LIGINPPPLKCAILSGVEWEDYPMRQSAKVQAIAERADFALWMIAAGVVIGAFIALAI
jgi:hypothetical protein